MFIAHGEWLRKYAHWILAGVLLLLLPGFILLFSPTASMKQQRASLPTINGKPIDVGEFQNARGTALVELVLSKGRQPARTSQVEDQLNMAAVQRLILLRKARELGIRVSDDELVQQIRALPVLLNDQKQFDPDRYQRYMISLNNLGINEAQFEEAMRTQIILSRLRALVGSAAKVTPTALQLSYVPVHEQTTVDYVEFNANDRKDSSDIKDDEARAHYEKNKEHFRTPAMVKVRYVVFSTLESKKAVKIGDEELVEYYDRNKDKYLDPATGKPKLFADVKNEVRDDLTEIRAERQVGDHATAFTVKLVPEAGGPRLDFTKTAADLGLTPKETDFFDVRSPVTNVLAGQQFNLAAFALTPDMPVSDPIRGEDGYYVLEYIASKPSGIPPFEQVKNEVIDRIRHQHAYEAAIADGHAADTKVKDALAAGKSFTDACTSLNLKVKTLGPFTLTDVTTNPPSANQIKEVALGMATNAVSDFISTATGGLFFHLKERTPPKSEDAAKDKQQLEAQLLEESREALFQDWAGSVIRAEHVDYKLKAVPTQQEQPAEDTGTDGQPAPAPAS